DVEKLFRSTMADSSSRGVREIGTQLLQPKSSFAKDFTPSEVKLLERGEGVYRELCFACHGSDGKGMPVQGGKLDAIMAPSLAGSKTVTGNRDGILNVVLKGLTGPVNGRTYEAQMVPMESNDDAWVAAITSYVRNSFGNHGTLIETNDVARVRAAL